MCWWGTPSHSRSSACSPGCSQPGLALSCLSFPSAGIPGPAKLVFADGASASHSMKAHSLTCSSYVLGPSLSSDHLTSGSASHLKNMCESCYWEDDIQSLLITISGFLYWLSSWDNRNASCWGRADGRADVACFPCHSSRGWAASVVCEALAIL